MSHVYIKIDVSVDVDQVSPFHELSRKRYVFCSCFGSMNSAETYKLKAALKPPWADDGTAEMKIEHYAANIPS